MAEETVTAARTIPYNDAHKANGLLFDALALIYAAADLNENGECLADPQGMTDVSCRVTSLLAMARDKTAAAIEALNV